MKNKNNSFVENVKQITNNFFNELIVTLNSNQKVSITNYEKILKFDEDILIVGNQNKSLKILGSNLILSEMADDYLIIDGTIRQVEFIN